MMKAMKIYILVMLVSFGIVGLWNKFPIIKNSISAVLNPTAGNLLDFNVTLGMIVVTAIITLLLTLVQKYTTDQESLRQLRKEQKLLQEEMKLYKDNPQKMLELQKKQFEFFPRTMDLTMSSLIYTSVPILLFFRWFSDYFATNPVKIFGFFSWFWAYLILSILFSMIFRKVFDMP